MISDVKELDKMINSTENTIKGIRPMIGYNDKYDLPFTIPSRKKKQLTHLLRIMKDHRYKCKSQDNKVDE